MAKNYWLVKQEPGAYSWGKFVKEGGSAWTGVRNFQARNNLRAMKKGDLYPDPTAKKGDWACVDLAPERALKKPVTLEAVKADKLLQGISLLRLPRLSVVPLTEAQCLRLLELGETEP